MKTITIVFRGLMVFNKQPGSMEIGFIDALYKPGNAPAHDNPHARHGNQPDHSGIHIPRILTMKNGILSSIFDLRHREELGTVRNWELMVTDPVQPTAETFEDGGDFVRTTHAVERDFRWISDLEASDLHDRPLSAEINTRRLLMVLYVRHGEFYTKLQSPLLRRRRLNPAEILPYGKNAAVVGCDIKVNDGGGVKLMAGGSAGAEVFDFGSDDNTLYEISNGPPDVPAQAPTPANAPGHFHMYYDKLFNAQPPMEQFDLVMDDGAPAPDPTLCGAINLGTRENPL
jgi:hypothetical protein